MNLIEEMLKPKIAPQQTHDPNQGLSAMLSFLAQGGNRGGGGMQLPSGEVNLPPLQSGQTQIPDTSDGLAWANFAGRETTAEQLAAQREDAQVGNDQLANVAAQFLGPRPADPKEAMLYDDQLRSLQSGVGSLQGQGLKTHGQIIDDQSKKLYGHIPYGFESYKADTPENRELYKSFKPSGVTVNTGDGTQMTPATAEEKAAWGLPTDVPATKNNKTGEVQAHPTSMTQDQGQVSVYVKELGDAIKQQKELYGTITQDPGLNKDFFGSILKDNNIPFIGNVGAVSALGNSMMSKERQSFESAAEKAKIMVIHALTAGGYTEKEASDKASAYIPSWGDKNFEQKMLSQESLMEGLRVRSGESKSVPTSTSVTPEMLDSVRQVESGGNPNAVSSAGARGPYQFMLGTWEQYGNGGDITNEADARAAAGRYFDDLLKQFGGDRNKALAAYNGGPARLERLGGDISKMPKESRDYVVKVNNAQFGPTKVRAAALTPHKDALVKDVGAIRTKTLSTADQTKLDEIRKRYGL